MQRKSMEIISVDFDAAGHLLFIYIRHLSNTGRKQKLNEAVHQLFMDFK